MRDVYDNRALIDEENCALHRADEIIRRSKIGEQRNDWRGFQRFALLGTNGGGSANAQLLAARQINILAA